MNRAAAAYLKRNRNTPQFRSYRKECAKKFRKAHPEYGTKLKVRFDILKAKCSYRTIELGIDFEQYKLLLAQMECFYCGEDLTKSKGCSLDRINSALGYVQGNCRPCCYRCNVMKADMPESEFIERLQRILERRIGI